MFLQTFLGILLMLLWMMVLGRVLVSWVDPQGRSPVASFLVQVTEPLLAPVRRFMPQTGMFDFSALIVLLVLGALMRAFLR
jgi:YggT family protein